MKNRINPKNILVCFSLLLVGFSNAQDPAQWHNAWGPYFRHINAVEILPDGKFVAVGGWPSNDSITAIFTSVDTAANWNIIADAPFSPMLMDVDFTSQMIGYTVGWAGEVRKTTDGGDNWSVVPGNTGSRDFMGCHFIDDMTGIIVGGNETNDSIQTILKTVNGGTTWSTIMDSQGSWLRAVHFADNMTGFAVGDDGTILKTVDGGDNWTAQTVPGSVSTRRFNDVHFVDQNTGVVVGGWEANDSIQTILQTTDGGANWNIILDNVTSMLNGVYFHNSTDGYAVGDDGVVLYTGDAGTTWINQVIPNNNTYHINDVFFANASFGLTGGSDGKLLWYVDTTTVSLDELTENTIIVYPNATEGPLTIGFNDKPNSNVDLKVIDMNGKVIIEQSILPTSNKITIDLSKQKPQYYYVIIGEGNSIHTFKTLLK